MPSFSVLKSGYVVKSEETRVIDSNAKVAERLQDINDRLMQEAEDMYGDDFSSDGFSVGLDAEQVELLLGDENYSEDEGVYREPENQVDMEAQISEMLENAQNEANEILESAKAEADSLLNNANAEAEEIKNRAMQEGHDQGYNDGYEEASRRAEEAELNCAQRERELEELYNQKIDELEPQFVEKITDIYEQIFKIDLSSRKDLVLHLLSDAIRGIEGAKNFLIHVSQDDYPYINEKIDELSQGLPTSAVIEVIEDVNLKQSDCFIEAESGIFDCGLDTELTLLKKELSLLSYKKD